MYKYKVNFRTIANVQRYVCEAAKFPGEIDIQSKRFTVDGKSALGIFSLDLTKDLTIVLYGEASDVEVFYESVLKNLVVERG